MLPQQPSTAPGSANGVVIITTKRGKSGKATVSFEHSSGLQEVRKKPDVLNPRQYAEFVANGRDNEWVYAGGKATDPNAMRNVSNGQIVSGIVPTSLSNNNLTC